MQVVVHGGMIREKPSSAEEAREFIKGLLKYVLMILTNSHRLPSRNYCVQTVFHPGYSAGHASTVGSVLVTNLNTGARKGGYDKAEV